MTSLAGGGRAALYEHARPPYADQVVKFVQSNVGGHLAAVMDIGCGTGLSTRPFRQIATSLVGVEPDDDMRATATESLSTIGVPVLRGRAEDTGLAARSVDLIVAASCFEWFDHQRGSRRVPPHPSSARVGAADVEPSRHRRRGHAGVGQAVA